MKSKQNGARPEPSATANPFDELGKVRPGDVIDIFMEETYLVKTVFDCHEAVGGETWSWRWIFLDDGSLIEVSPDGFFRYREHRILKQGTSEYEGIVAQDGALVRFEAHVRAGDSGRRPVHLTFDGKEYRISSTGTAAVERQGDEPALLPWQSLSEDAAENVYFGLVESAEATSVALGLWTSHVCLSVGHPLEATSLSAVYRK